MIIMKNSLKFPLTVCLLIALTGCSSYRTNTDISFSSTLLSGQKPAMPVDAEVPADQITYLGWVDARVVKPSYFHDAATKEQANIVLAEQAKKLGADAVINVNYKRGINMATLPKLDARGQAVRINAWHIGEPDPSVVMAEHAYTSPTLTLPNNGNTHSKPVIDLNAKAAQTAPSLTTTSVDLTAIVPLTATATIPAAASVTSATTAVNTIPNAANTATTPSMADPMGIDKGEQVNSLNIMLANAKFLQAKAKEHKDKDMYKSASRLVHQIENHMLEYTDAFPNQ